MNYLSDPYKILNSIVPYEVFEENNKIIKIWKTNYGVSFEDHGCGFIWFYKYNNMKDTDFFTNEDKLGTISGSDIKNVIKQLKNNQNKLKNKPTSIQNLETLTGKTAYRKHNLFGGWHIIDKEKYSIINNPFSCNLYYTKGENNFEVWFMDKEEEPRGYQTIEEIETLLKEYKYISN